MLKLSPGICGVSLFLSNTVTQQQTLSLLACFSFIFNFLRNLNHFDFFRETSPFVPGSCEQICATQTAGRQPLTRRRGRSTCCHVFVGGLCCLPSHSPLLPPSLPTSALPPRSRSPDCVSLPRSLTVRERMLSNAQPLSVRASEPHGLVPDTRPREKRRVEKARSPGPQAGQLA